jgi:hypothetical protein
MSQWIPFPKSKPDRAGYYMTVYYNFESTQYLHKAIWWSGLDWITWRPDSTPDLSKVKCFAPETKHNYYTTCVDLAQKIITERPLCSNT